MLKSFICNRLLEILYHNFTLSQIHAKNEVPDLGQNSVPLVKGIMYTFTVTPSIVSTDPEVQSMDLGVRGCFSQASSDDGAELDIFQNYTQAKCFFECRKEK